MNTDNIKQFAETIQAGTPTAADAAQAFASLFNSERTLADYFAEGIVKADDSESE
jgi:hypothetical protein